MSDKALYDLVIYGASGFTGRLVAEYVHQTYGKDRSLSWAMAGRNLDKLAQVRGELGIAESVPLIVADGDDMDSLLALARQTRLVLTTVGPYQLYGEKLVAACAEVGTDYVDLCGEPAWMRQMIDAYDTKARDSGARIVFSCGFDSIPFDLGVFFLQEEARKRLGEVFPRVHGRVRKMKGTFSGGTAASLKATMAAAAKDPSILDLLRNPFSLTPGFEGPRQPSGMKPMHDPVIDSWVAPFIMAPINTRNVHRSNALLAYTYGTQFVYDEMLVTGPGEKGEKLAHAIANDRSMASGDGPKPGEGPSREERENGFYDVLFVGEMPDGRQMRASVTGDRDPGYGSTSKMITESALCLLRDVPKRQGGILTPASIMGGPLIRRLVDHAGLTFTIES